MSGPLLRVDMHVHTRCSYDCLSRFEEILAALPASGIDRVVITDHNEIRGAQELRALAPERVMVGEEVRAAEGFDIIGIFLDELIPAGTPAREVCERIHAQGGVVYLPHPFDGWRGGSPAVLEPLLELIDVVEVHNARAWPASRNGEAARWARRRGKLQGAGSDAHTIREIGRACVELPAFEPERTSFLRALAHGRVAEARVTSPVYRLASTWAKLRKRLPVRERR